jgi:glucokinase
VGRHCLAVDIGGTKMAVGLVDEHAGCSLARRIPTPRSDDPGVLLEALATQVHEVLRSAGDRTPEVCGVGCGGPMSPHGEEVSPLNIPAWRGFPLRRTLAGLTGLPTFVDNDAKALALAEGWAGAARGEGNYMAMVVSTGVGGGIVLDGRLLDGREGNAGHVGHVVVEPTGRACSCGGHGCLEAEASGTAIAAATGRPPSEAGPDVVARAGMLVGRAVASVANLLDLRLAVVAGSVALGYGEPFFAAAREEVDRRARLSFSAGTRVVPAALGEDGPLAGAGAVGWRGIGALGEGPR